MEIIYCAVFVFGVVERARGVRVVGVLRDTVVFVVFTGALVAAGVFLTGVFSATVVSAVFSVDVTVFDEARRVCTGVMMVVSSKILIVSTNFFCDFLEFFACFFASFSFSFCSFFKAFSCFFCSFLSTFACSFSSFFWRLFFKFFLFFKLFCFFLKQLFRSWFLKLLLWHKSNKRK